MPSGNLGRKLFWESIYGTLSSFFKPAMEEQAAEGHSYRLTSSIGQGVWRVYGTDDHGQERYLGRIIQVKDGYEARGNCGITDGAFSDRDEAASALYQRCMQIGYLKKEHPNYLKQLK